MKETKNTFIIEETDSFCCIHFGEHKKATNGDRCPKCESTCLIRQDLPHGMRGRCVKCGYFGRLKTFKPFPKKEQD